MHASGRTSTPAARIVAWAGAGLFLVSLGYFLVSYAFRFGVVVPGPVRANAVIWNVVLFSVFALHHSVFARDPVRRWVIRAFPHLERSVYVWIASVLFVLVCWLWQPVAGVVWDVRGVSRWILPLVQIVGLWLAFRSAAIIGVWELAGVHQPPDTGTSDSVEFSTNGPYGWVRHPIYLGWFLMVFALARMTTTQFVFAVISCAYILIAIPFEERSLRRTTHGAYERYVTRVPWKLVPRLF